MTSLDNQWRHAPGLGLAPGARWSDLMAHIDADPTPHSRVRAILIEKGIVDEAAVRAEQHLDGAEPERVLAVADQLDGADADSAFVAEQMRDAVTAPTTGWLAHAIERWFG
jgi:hypothetical protein